MSNEQFEHIQKIRQTYRDDSELSKANQINLIKIIAEDLNNTDAHFIFELIQNAEDNTYVEPSPYISFWLTKTDPTYTDGSEGALIVENNEVGFNRNDVDAICAAAQSPKRKKHGYIGEKGIGFKSVFRVTETPHIFSNGYHFCLPKSDEETELGYIVPQWIDVPPRGLDPSKTYIILPLNRAEFGYNKIEDMLQDIDPETILFLSKLQDIQIKTDTGTDLAILKNDSAKPKVEILIEGKKQGRFFSIVNDFLVCKQTFHKPAHIRQEKREDIEERDISIAFQLAEVSKGLGKIYAYLPVKTIDFPFLINADFILTSSREDIHQDSPWNHWLVECIADFIAKELLPLLKERDLLSIDFLEALATKLNNLAEDKSDLFYPVSSKLCETFMNEELLPADDHTFVSTQNAVLTRSTPVRNLLTYAQLAFLFLRSDVESDSELKWLSADITLDRTPNLRHYLIHHLGIDEVTPASFARKLSENFLSRQKDEWFVKFYKFLSRQPTLWNSDVSILRTKPILRLEDGTHVTPPRDGCDADVYLLLDVEANSSLPTVRTKISEDKDALKFLKDLGVPDWDVVAEVIRHILPKYSNNSSVISKAEYNGDFSKIVNAYSTASQKKKELLQETLLITPFIFTESSHADNQIYLRPNQLCFGTDDGLWSNNSIGTYSSVFVSKEVCKFLRTLDIPKWDIVDEVIKTILPTYKQNPPKVSIEEHMNDFKKIILAYESSNQFRKADLKTELQATHFILAENPDADFPIYLSANNLYFSTDTLQMYFKSHSLVSWIEIWNDDNEDLADLWSYFVDDSVDEPPIFGAFVNLDKYPDTARTLVEDLGVADTVRVKRKKKDNQGRVSIINQHSYHRRGLDGFDPDIYVDGLEYVIECVTSEKSAFIWNEIAIPNADCIRGTIEMSRNQQYRNSQSVKDISKKFGRLLIDTKWLPDSDGNMHRPSEITLAELPEEFIPNERLADQLRMKKNEVAELADKIGVSEASIKEYIENKEEFEKWQAEKEKQEQIPSPEWEESESKTISHLIDYPAEIEKSFNKSGVTEVKSQIIDEGKVKNPERRRKKIADEHRDRLNGEPSADNRRRETYRAILEGPDPQVREYLSQMYGGKCQICDDTFPERGGKPFFVASYIVERQKPEGIDTSANALCLCADHFAKFKHGTIEAEDIPTQIKNFQTESEGGDCKPILEIKLCGDKCEIRFKEKHLLDLQELIKVSNDD
jgi:predicted transcriptional regulator